MLLKYETMADKEIIVTQKKSIIGTNEDQRKTLKGLGLKGVNSSSVLKCDKSIYGMLLKVVHLIDVKIK